MFTLYSCQSVLSDYLAYTRILSMSSFFLIGLAIWPVQPASRHLSTSSFRACAVKAMTGVSFLSFMLSHSLMPLVAE